LVHSLAGLPWRSSQFFRSPAVPPFGLGVSANAIAIPASTIAPPASPRAHTNTPNAYILNSLHIWFRQY
jgi:hypothetical protein